jgi:DNA-binding transcriptional regulator YiaG
MKGESKYQPLLEYLQRSDQREVTLTLAEIEALMGQPLPDSARTRKAWWSNRKQGGLQARAWMDADYLAEADLLAEQITFRKPPEIYTVERVGDTVLWNGELIRALRRHLKFSQMEFAEHLGVHQATISQWENHAYQPTLATSKHLSMVAEQAGFQYGQPRGSEEHG